jgi:dTDP-4-amino-4,6-dideoxygalactose transaminase
MSNSSTPSNSSGLSIAQKNLALYGGKPVREKWLAYSRQKISAADKEAILKVLDQDLITRGPQVKAFEEEIADYVGFPYCVAMNSATAGLHAAMACMGMKAGDKVALPPLTFAATANAALYCGAEVQFVDCRPDTLNVNEEELLKTSSQLKVFVDYAGNPADTRKIPSGNKRPLHLVDAAHSLSARLDGKHASQWVDAAVFSFHPVKPITSGEGGAVVVRDQGLAEELRRFRNHGISREEKPGYSPQYRLGFNYHMTEIQAALGRTQLQNLEDFRQKRQELAAAYSAAFKGNSILRPLSLTTGAESSWHLYPVLLEEHANTWGGDHERVLEALRAENIGVQIHYLPVHWHPYYQALGFKKGICPVAEDAYGRLLSLPLHPAMELSDIEDVLRALEKVQKALSKKD